jgi:hypothetical protein
VLGIQIARVAGDLNGAAKKGAILRWRNGLTVLTWYKGAIEP